MNKTSLTTAALLTTAASLASGFSITGQEIGNDVVFTYSGSINTDGLTSGGDQDVGFFETEIEAQDDEISAIDTTRISFWETPDATTSITGSMGFGGEHSGSAVGDAFGVYENPTNYLIILEEGYTSGENITGTITFTNTSFVTLGVTNNNTVTYSWGSGGNADSIVFSTVPEPSSSALWLGLITVVVPATRRRRR